MPASNLNDEERAYFHAPRNEAFRKNPNAKYRYIYRKAYDRKYENNNPNAPIVNYGPFSSKMNQMNQMKTNSAKTRKNRKNKSRKNRKNRKGNTRRS
jgi:hypothetical protein